MDRGIGMDALITAGPQDIGDGAITINTGVTATTTVETGIAVKSRPEEIYPPERASRFRRLDDVIYSLAPGNC